jgi:peptide deformylase
MIINDLEFLRNKSEPVLTVSEAQDIIKKLIIEKSNEGVGLAAIQIGIQKQVAIVIGRGEVIPIINPQIIEMDEEFIFDGEGCLSFPKIFCKSKRYRHFVIKNNVIDGDKFREETQYYFCGTTISRDFSLSDYEAIAVQHEIDHFFGKTIMDYGYDKYENSTGVKRMEEKVGRNDPCPCGKKDLNGNSIKYKKCCGK